MWALHKHNIFIVFDRRSSKAAKFSSQLLHPHSLDGVMLTFSLLAKLLQTDAGFSAFMFII